MADRERIPRTMRKHLVPIDRIEFAQVYEIMSVAYNQLLSGNRVLPDDEYERAEITAAFKRSHDAVSEYYRGDWRAVFNSTLRVQAMHRLVDRGVLDEWVRGEGDATDIHRSVVFAAAEVPLNRDGNFRARQFIQAVRRINAEES